MHDNHPVEEPTAEANVPESARIKNELNIIATLTQAIGDRLNTLPDTVKRTYAILQLQTAFMWISQAYEEAISNRERVSMAAESQSEEMSRMKIALDGAVKEAIGWREAYEKSAAQVGSLAKELDALKSHLNSFVPVKDVTKAFSVKADKQEYRVVNEDLELADKQDEVTSYVGGIKNLFVEEVPTPTPTQLMPTSEKTYAELMGESDDTLRFKHNEAGGEEALKEKVIASLYPDEEAPRKPIVG